MDELGAVNVLRRVVKEHGSQAAAARELGFSRAHLCRVLSGQKHITERLLTALKLSREVTIKAIKPVKKASEAR